MPVAAAGDQRQCGEESGKTAQESVPYRDQFKLLPTSWHKTMNKKWILDCNH